MAAESRGKKGGEGLKVLVVRPFLCGRGSTGPYALLCKRSEESQLLLVLMMKVCCLSGTAEQSIDPSTGYTSNPMFSERSESQSRSVL